MRTWLLLILTFWLLSCSEKQNKDSSITEEQTEVQRYDNTFDDTSIYFYDDINYEKLCQDLFIKTYTPEIDKLFGKPNSYKEWISEFSNWTKEDYERTLKESDGMLFLDTTDRDYEKKWYNSNGMLEKYENRRFGDMINNECLFFYTSDNTILKLQINDLVKNAPEKNSFFKYKNQTIEILKNGKVLNIRHNIVKSPI